MKIKHISIRICEACLNGEGQECHTPGCALFLHSVDLPIDVNLYQVLDEYEDAPLSSSSSRAAECCACKNGGWFDFKGVCINCGGAKPPPA